MQEIQCEILKIDGTVKFQRNEKRDQLQQNHTPKT